MTLKNSLYDKQLNSIDAYVVESELLKGLIYLSDFERIVIYRKKDLIVFPIEETKLIIGKMRTEFAKELMEIYKDILDLKAKGCCKWQMKH